MPRNDDIGDLPSLMPDSDEIKRTAKPSFSASNENVDAPPTRGRREASRPISAPRPLQQNAPPVVMRSSGFLWFLVMLMFFGVSGGGYWSYNKLTDVDLLLTVSRGELDHARKRIGELEALVVATDVNSNKSGTVVQTQVKQLDNRVKERNKFVDTEIDKLWGVAYRTNRPAISEHQKAIDNNTARVKQHQEKWVAQDNLIERYQSTADAQQKQIDAATKASEGAVENVQDQLHKVVLLQDKLASLLTQVTAQEKTLSDQAKTDVGQAQLAQQHAQDLAGLADLVKGLSVQSGGEETNTLLSRINELEKKSRVLTAIEQNESEMDERVYLVEQSIDSVNSFRRDTNRMLDQLQSQIRNLAYGE